MLVRPGSTGPRCSCRAGSRQHAQPAYLLECTATTGEPNRMIQFKGEGTHQPTTRAALFTYLALMAADILLYGPRRVPVGADQRQHVELTRDLASASTASTDRSSRSPRSRSRRPARG